MNNLSIVTDSRLQTHLCEYTVYWDNTDCAYFWSIGYILFIVPTESLFCYCVRICNSTCVIRVTW